MSRVTLRPASFATGLVDSVVPILRRGGRLLVRSWLRASAWWRRSIQLRVVATTLAASIAVVAILGILVLNQVAAGLVATKRKHAVREVETGQRYATQQLETVGGPTDPALDPTLRAVVANLSERGGSAGRFTVAMRTENPRLPNLYVARYDAEDVQIPASLADLVDAEHVLAYQYVSLTLDEGARRPFLVIGTPVTGPAGDFTLYYFYPLDEEATTVDLVRNALIGMGVLLVLLLAGIAWLVIRQVVTPVRMAARTAERLSAGLLEERMSVQGEDDLARLAHSFNQMASNLQQQIVQLEDLSRLQRRFTSDVSHELRTPLTTIRMAADILHSSRDDFSPEVARSAELLTKELDRFEALLADLLEISRYDSGFAVLEPEPTDIGALITRVVAGLSTLAADNHVELRMRLPEEPVVAEVDSRRVERILRNLIGNAIEYGAGKPIRIVVAAEAGIFAITVRDYGAGFAADDAAAVFNRFWRADPSRARKTGGTGLGLSIAAEDARLHGGWLEAWGQPDGGAQFRLTLALRAGGAVTSSPLPIVPVDAREVGDARS